MISVMFVGHLGKFELACVSVATSFASVTGLTVLAGMAGGLDTLCGQAFDAGQHRLLGMHKQRAMLVLTLLSVPVATVWAYTGEILAWCGQDPEIAAAAGSYIRWLIPALFLYGPLQGHVRFLQMQKLVLPVMLSSGAAALGHPVVCWLLVRRLGLGSKGVALGNAVSYLVNLWLMALYVRLSPSCKNTGGRAFPARRSALLVLLAGLLPNPKLETAVLSICQHNISFAAMVPIGLGAAASTRVSNELGAGRPHAARLATRVVMFLAFSVCLSEGLGMGLSPNLLGYAYSNDGEVAKYTARLMPVLAVCILFDGLQSVLSDLVDFRDLQNKAPFGRAPVNSAPAPALASLVD
ncbi:Protein DETOXIFICATION 16 [Dichanthelium oligosanthes]|uniref:Protein DETOXIFICATION 16 n=1 Tax=Dichanthelium oligosanthes TaxID=888268 RepID=A0A1E5USW0_9POAL|nr:Protein DETOXIFICATION 16 [Dichanthelium oligosanthes]